MSSTYKIGQNDFHVIFLLDLKNYYVSGAKYFIAQYIYNKDISGSPTYIMKFASCLSVGVFFAKTSTINNLKRKRVLSCFHSLDAVFCVISVNSKKQLLRWGAPGITRFKISSQLIITYDVACFSDNSWFEDRIKVVFMIRVLLFYMSILCRRT